MIATIIISIDNCKTAGIVSRIMQNKERKTIPILRLILRNFKQNKQKLTNGKNLLKNLKTDSDQCFAIL